MAEVDIIIPTYNRLSFLKNCLRSLWYNTTSDYRLFIVDDCSTDGTAEWLATLEYPKLEEVILNKRRRGLTFNFDILWDVIEGLDYYYGDTSKYLCLLQDDIEIMEKDWLTRLITVSEMLSGNYKIGFFSGHDAPEHPTIATIGEAKIKKSMRATNMIGLWSFWKSIGKVPRLQPNGTERGFPSNGNKEGQRGRGSNFDLYLTGCQSKGKVVDFGRTTKSSCYHQGRVCMVIPGLVKHIATEPKDSTWGNKNIEEIE